MAGKGRLGGMQVSRRLTACVLAPAVAALGLAWAAGDGFSRLREGVVQASTVSVAALSPAVRLMQAADGLGAAAVRLLWSDSYQSRSAARAAAELHRTAVADYLAARPDLTVAAAGRQIADALERLNLILEAADRLAERRLAALAGLPAARERLVVLLAELDGLLAQRRANLNALPRFHPDTQRELERHDEWRRVSKSLLGALLLTANAADGQSGAAGAAAAYLARLNQITAAFPDSDFAQTARRQQENVVAAVNGPAGALTQLAALRQAQEAATGLAVDIRRVALDLSQAGADHVEAARADVDARLFEMATLAADREFLAAAGGLAGLLAAAVGVIYARRRVGGRLRRLRAAFGAGLDGGSLDGAGGRVAAAASGDDDIAALAAAAQALLDDVKRREAALEESRVRFELAVEAGGGAVWDENLAEGRVWWSPGYYRLLGCAPDEIVPAVGAWEMLVHPDDRAAAAEAAERCLAGLATSYAATYRLRRKDGAWIWVEDHGGVQRDADGLPVRFVGLMRDVSRRRRAEIGLRQAKEAADASARAGGDLLAAAERRLRPGLRRLTAKLTQLEAWALTEEQRRLVAEVKQDGQDVLETLAALGQVAAKRDAGGGGSDGVSG